MWPSVCLPFSWVSTRCVATYRVCVAMRRVCVAMCGWGHTRSFISPYVHDLCLVVAWTSQVLYGPPSDFLTYHHLVYDAF